MISVGDKRATIYHGDYHPAALYKGDQMIAGWQDHPMSGADWSAENTYNDALPLEILGKSHQENYRVGVLDGEIVQFEDGENGTEMVVTSDVDCTVTRCGRNLLQNNGAAQKSSAGITYTKLADGKVRVTGQSTEWSVYLINQNLTFLAKAKSLSFTGNTGGSNLKVAYLELVYKVNGAVLYKAINTSGFTLPVDASDIDIRITNLASSDTRQDSEIWSMVMLGTKTDYPYEPYTGQTYTIQANTPTKIPLLDGCNTVFADAGNLHVEYRKAATAAASSTDIVAPTPDWPSTIKSSGGSNVIVAGNAGKSLTIPLPEGFGGLPNAQDRLFLQDGKCWLEKWMDTPDPTKPLSAQVLASSVMIDITSTPTGQAMLAARTYPHFTRVYSDADENLKPTISATIKEVAL